MGEDCSVYFSVRFSALVLNELTICAVCLYVFFHAVTSVASSAIFFFTPSVPWQRRFSLSLSQYYFLHNHSLREWHFHVNVSVHGECVGGAQCINSFALLAGEKPKPPQNKTR